MSSFVFFVFNCCSFVVTTGKNRGYRRCVGQKQAAGGIGEACGEQRTTAGDSCSTSRNSRQRSHDRDDRRGTNGAALLLAFLS